MWPVSCNIPRSAIDHVTLCHHLLVVVAIKTLWILLLTTFEVHFRDTKVTESNVI